MPVGESFFDGTRRRRHAWAESPLITLGFDQDA